MRTKLKGILTLFLALIVQITFAQQKTVSGTVSDKTGSLPGVSILIKGQTTGTETDFDGKYSIKVKTGDILVFSYLGYKTVEKTVGASNTIDVVMVEDANVLDEIVVTALGLSRDEKTLGYSAQKVKADKIAGTGQSNLVNAINGKVAGVNIVSSSGAPGASSNITIRGSSSISGNNQPLFVVDGLPISNNTDNGSSSGTLDGTDFRDYGKTVGVNRAADIDPNDIESITVLKGGAATALYGNRAVNGAIIITTKKGRSGNGLNVTLSSRLSFETVNKLPSFTHQYARGRNGAYSNVTHWSWGPAYADNPVFPAGTNVDLAGTGTATDVSGQAIPLYRDNYKNFWNDGTTKQISASVSGGDDKGNFYASIGRNDQEGVIPNSLYERVNATV